ncbi:MAG TPA: extensin family protein [Croceibacterium sp.]|nr:extensin family protein [Croceibacterium sp.]
MKMRFSRYVGGFRLDRALLGILILLGIFVAARAWLAEHPQHDPWAPLDLGNPPGWATRHKLAALRNDPGECRMVLERSGVVFDVLPPAGEGECRREDRTVLSAAPLSPDAPPVTCPVAAGFELWLRQGVQPAAETVFGQKVARIEHFGAYGCRRMYGRANGRWSEHASGNALDIAAFVLADGRRISVLRGWNGTGGDAEFLHQIRDHACGIFGTVLSPDYNAAHADHLHLDQARRGAGGFCR